MSIGALLAVLLLLNFANTSANAFILDSIQAYHNHHDDGHCLQIPEYTALMQLVHTKCLSDTQVWLPLKQLLEKDRGCLQQAIDKIAANVSPRNDLDCMCDVYFNKQKAISLGNNHDHLECIFYFGNCQKLFSYFYLMPQERIGESNCVTHNHVWNMLTSVERPGYMDLLDGIVFHLGDTFRNGKENICSCRTFESVFQSQSTTTTSISPQTAVTAKPTTTLETDASTPSTTVLTSTEGMQTFTEGVQTSVEGMQTTHNSPTGTSVTTQPWMLWNLTQCVRYNSIYDLSKHVIESHPDAYTCKSGNKTSSEAYVLANCDVSTPSKWTEGINVMQHCDKIPPYTPIATFGVVYLGEHEHVGLSGIFLGCTEAGFKIAAQRCDMGAAILYVEPGEGAGPLDPNMYFVIE